MGSSSTTAVIRALVAAPPFLRDATAPDVAWRSARLFALQALLQAVAMLSLRHCGALRGLTKINRARSRGAREGGKIRHASAVVAVDSGVDLPGIRSIGF